MDQSKKTSLASTPPAPLTWLLLGSKMGDNNQVLALAEALGWPYLSQQLHFHWYELTTNLLLKTTLAGVNLKRSDNLQPPWPELIITAGRRNEPVARWIKEKNSGNTKIVHIGRPWASLDIFDIIVTTPQYFLPQNSRVLTIDLPLHRVNPDRLATAAHAWRAQFSHLPHPWIAVLLGGNSGKYVFTQATGRRLGQLANQMAESAGGSLLITNSARTPPPAYEACLKELDTPAHIYQWEDNDQADNPYLGYLALADKLVVTGESMSMLAEAEATGKPVYIFDPRDDSVQPWWRHAHNFRFKPLSHRLAMRFGPARMHRDVGRIQQALINSKRATWLGQQAPSDTRAKKTSDTQRAVRRIRSLFGY
ncbi:MAG: nucleoside-diphosphate sugar epimerase [Gammaproteobacteria bacterium]|nr:MAG: nucleoside-diphosphate sugar epimerase [Gammaproteobacteria bacterium]